MGIPSNAAHQPLQISFFQLRFSRKLEVTDLREEEVSVLQLQIYFSYFYVRVITDSEAVYNFPQWGRVNDVRAAEAWSFKPQH